jgi:hypothetical protein
MIGAVGLGGLRNGRNEKKKKKLIDFETRKKRPIATLPRRRWDHSSSTAADHSAEPCRTRSSHCEIFSRLNAAVRGSIE